MNIKKRLLKRISSLEDNHILQRLEQWLQFLEKHEEVREKQGIYSTTSDTDQAEITIQVFDNEKMDRLVNLAEKLGLTYQIRSYQSLPKSKAEAISWLEKIADEGGVKEIENPVDWQRKERRDRSLPGFREV